MSNEKYCVHFGYKLINATLAFLKKMAELKMFLKSQLPECEFLEILEVVDVTAGDVYKKNISENVAICDLFIVFIDEESTGAGIEFGAALYGYGKPVLVLATEGLKVSWLCLGAEEHHSEQIMVSRVVSPISVVIAIREAIKAFKLDTENPARFQGRYT
ncbi:MAG: hypothetical protein RLZZ67_86 [Candidatus Parcubacteria bacterium]|jgi:hypothetical protein